jgi:hypothetical protein
MREGVLILRVTHHVFTDFREAASDTVMQFRVRMRLQFNATQMR